MAVIISVINNKGGSQKTVTAVNLACALARKPNGMRCCVLDSDPQSNASLTLGKVEPEAQPVTTGMLFSDDRSISFKDCIVESKYPGIDLIPASLTMMEVANHVAGTLGATHSFRTKLDRATQEKYDFIICDTPPALSGPFVLNSLLISDYILIPVESASKYSLVGMDQLMSVVSGLNEYTGGRPELLGVLIGRYDSRTSAARIVENLVLERFGGKVFKTRIHRSTTVEQAVLNNRSILDYDPKSPSACQFMELAREVLERLGMEPGASRAGHSGGLLNGKD